jgi:hypothetical protein
MTRPLIIAALALSACTAPELATRADQIVTYDLGGSVNARQAQIADIRDARQTVAVTGVCASACTLYLQLQRHDQLCTTRRARWLFHGVYYKNKQLPEGMAQQILADRYNLEVARAYPPLLREQFLSKWLNLGPTEYATVTGAEMIDRHGIKECSK